MALGIPLVREFGSTFGTFGGYRLSDYETPEPNASQLGKSNEASLVEFKTFQQGIKDFVLARLGHPVIKVELTDYQIETCIDESINKLEYHAPQWMNQFAVIDTSAGINLYELPLEIASNLTNAWYKRQVFGFGGVQGSLEYDFTIAFFTNNGLFANGAISEYVLMQQYLKQIRKVLGQGGSWELMNNKYLHLSPTPDGEEEVILEFRGIDSNTILPIYRSWLQRYSLACAKEILGRIRSKFQTLPGPGGGAKLDGEILLRESVEEKEKLMEELTSAIDNPPLFDFW